jgi:transcriptional regulator with AAA-type ATPase domain
MTTYVSGNIDDLMEVIYFSVANAYAFAVTEGQHIISKETRQIKIISFMCADNDSNISRLFIEYMPLVEGVFDTCIFVNVIKDGGSFIAIIRDTDREEFIMALEDKIGMCIA